MFVPENGKDGYWTLVQCRHHRVVDLFTNDLRNAYRSPISITSLRIRLDELLLCAHSRRAARLPEEISQFHLVIAPQVDRNEIRLFAL